MLVVYVFMTAYGRGCDHQLGNNCSEAIAKTPACSLPLLRHAGGAVSGHMGITFLHAGVSPDI